MKMSTEEIKAIVKRNEVLRKELAISDPGEAAFCNPKNNNWDKATYSEISKRIASNKEYRKAFAISNPSEAAFLTGDGKRTRAFYYSQTESERKKVKK